MIYERCLVTVIVGFEYVQLTQTVHVRFQTRVKSYIAFLGFKRRNLAITEIVHRYYFRY